MSCALVSSTYVPKLVQSTPLGVREARKCLVHQPNVKGSMPNSLLSRATILMACSTPMKRSCGAHSTRNVFWSAIIGRRFEYDPLDTFVELVMEGPASTAGTSYNAEIDVLEVAFDIAVVKVVDDWLGERYTDYLTMLKHDGKWSIVNKAFTVHPPM